MEKPLREALDYLRDELVKVFEKEGTKYFDDVWEVRNNYIQVILDRSRLSIEKFQKENFKPGLTEEDKVKAMELLEIQRQTLLMYTSCGWFFSEISGIETVQIMKYAARAMQLAGKFTGKNLEKKFLELLDEAKSNIPEHGTGKDIFEKFVRPSIVTLKQVACLWAISSLYQDFEDKENVYCYIVTRKDYQHVQKGNSTLIMGNIEIKSIITNQKSNLVFALIQYADGDFHCSIKEYSDDEEYYNLKQNLTRVFVTNTITEIIRALDEAFGKEYFTLKDIFIEERRKVLQLLLKDKMAKFAQTYQELYKEGKNSIYQMQNLGVAPPEEFKIAAKYALGKRFNDIILDADGYVDEAELQRIEAMNIEAKALNINLDKTPSNKIFAKKIETNINRLAYSMEMQQAELLLELFDYVEKMGLEIDIAEAQNTYFTRIYHRIGEIIEAGKKSKRSSEKHFALMLLDIGDKLNINTDFYRTILEREL